MRPIPRSRSRREGGAALLIAMMFLIFMAVLGTSALDTVMLDRQVAGFQSQRRAAFQAALAGTAVARSQLTTGSMPSLVQTALGDSNLYPHGQPTYGPDTSVANPIEDLGASGANGMNLRISGGGPQFQMHFYRIRVEGRSPQGAVARQEVAAGVLVGN